MELENKINKKNKEMYDKYIMELENKIDKKNIKKILKKTNKEMYDNFKEKNAGKIKEKITCDICGGKYTYFNKSGHYKTTKHKIHQELKNLQDKII
jgi:hypothetical protein